MQTWRESLNMKLSAIFLSAQVLRGCIPILTTTVIALACAPDELPNLSRSEEHATAPKGNHQYSDEDATKKSANSEEQSFSHEEETENTDTTSLTEEDISLNSEILRLQSKRIAVDVNSAAFKITGLRVGVEEKLMNNVPAIFFFPVEPADFYQLIRCEQSADISGPFASLEEVEITVANIEDEIRAHKENRFWQVAETLAQCTKVSDALVRTVYYDENLSDGSYKYLARACTIEAAQEAICSDLVSLSTSLSDYRNVSSAWNTFMLEEIAQTERSIEELSLRLSLLSQDFANSVIKCEDANNRRALSSQRKMLLTKVLGIGAQIGGHLILNDFSTPLEAASSVWAKRKDLAARGKPLITLLQELFITEDDAQISCTEAEYVARQAKIVLGEIAALKQVVNSLSGSSSGGGE